MRLQKSKSLFLIATLATTAMCVGCIGCDGTDQSETTNENTTNYEWHIVIAENGLSKELLLEVGTHYQELIGHQAAPNDVVNLILAPSHETICSIVVPEGNAKSRLRDPDVRKFIPKIAKVFASESVNSSGNAHIRLPDLVNTISAGRRTNFPSRIIIIGSPLFQEPTYADWKMIDGKFPSDGTLKAKYSPFNIEGKYPKGTEITWVVPRPQWGGRHSQYEEAVVRFDRLLIQEQSATLVRLTNDPQMAFIFENPQYSDKIEARDEPAIMHQFQQAPKPTIQQTGGSGNAADAEAVLEAAQADRTKIALAIEWESEERHCDLDLWIECKGHPKKMNYANKNTPFGKLFRDVMSSSGGNTGNTDIRGMEWLEINHNRLEDLTCWIHVFSGSKPMTVRMIRVWKGQRSEKTFQITPSQRWNKIDLSSF